MTDPHDPSEGFARSERLAALEADNARLRRLLDQAGTHDGLRHAFRDTVAALRMLVRQTAETATEVEGYAAHLEGRLDALVRVRGRIDAFGEADLHGLVSDELAVHLAKEGDRAHLAGPGLRLRPKAAQVLALAVHELASNAVEHGRLAHSDGHVDVTWRVETWRVEAGPTLALVWKERGAAGSAGESAGPRRRGFGMAVLEDMLTYDLAARASLSFEPDGLRCGIRLPLTERVGRLLPDEAVSPRPLP